MWAQNRLKSFAVFVGLQLKLMVGAFGEEAARPKVANGMRSWKLESLAEYCACAQCFEVLGRFERKNCSALSALPEKGSVKLKSLNSAQFYSFIICCDFDFQKDNCHQLL